MSSSYDATAQTKVEDPSKTQSTISPITGQAVVTRPLASSTSSLDSAVDSSHAAYLSWRKVPLKERIELVTKGIKHLAGRNSELALELTEQMGRPIRYGNAEFSTFDDRGMWLVGQAEKALGDETVGDDRPEGFRRIIRRAPVGVCLLVGAWNVRTITSFISLSSSRLIRVSMFFHFLAMILVPLYVPLPSLAHSRISGANVEPSHQT